MKKFFLIAILFYLLGFGAALVFKNYFLYMKINLLSIDYANSVTKTPNDLFFEILNNNSNVYLACISGFMTFGIYTALCTFYNGFVLGYLLATLNRFFDTYAFILDRLLPHSFEIIGVIISSTLGFYLTHYFVGHFFFKSNLHFEFKKAGTLFIIGYLIILTSALIESHVSAA